RPEASAPMGPRRIRTRNTPRRAGAFSAAARARRLQTKTASLRSARLPMRRRRCGRRPETRASLAPAPQFHRESCARRRIQSRMRVQWLALRRSERVAAVMPDHLSAPRGTADIFPPESARWNELERRIRGLAERYGYGEIR